VTPTTQKSLVLLGATGMVGGFALRWALGHSAVKCVTTIVHRKLDISHPKLNEVMHRGFAN
jgi:NADPH:quinone reductase-like Zn-dependent oxidoreductase